MSGFDVGVHGPLDGPVNGLDAEQTKALVEYIGKLQRDLLLHAWTIRLVSGPPSNDVVASTFVATQGRFAEMRFHPTLFDADHDEGDVRQTVMHELLHLHVENLFDDMLGMLEEALPQAGFLPLRKRQVWQMERAVDGLADAIAPKYDLIEWPTKPNASDPARLAE